MTSLTEKGAHLESSDQGASHACHTFHVKLFKTFEINIMHWFKNCENKSDWLLITKDTEELGQDHLDYYSKT